MNKKILIILVLSMTILCIAGCSTTNNDFDIGKISEIETLSSGITLSIKEGTLTKRGATLILKNNTDKSINYGDPYAIQIKQDNNWHDINLEIAFNAPLWTLESNKVTELELNWEYSYGELSKGEYRIIKGIDIETKDGTLDEYYVAVEFDIK